MNIAAVMVIPGGMTGLIIVGVVIVAAIVFKAVAKSRQSTSKPKPERTPMEWARGEHPAGKPETPEQFNARTGKS